MGDGSIPRVSGSQFRVGCKLGDGAWSSVFKCCRINSGTVYALKALKSSCTEHDAQIWMRQIQIEAKIHVALKLSPDYSLNFVALLYQVEDGHGAVRGLVFELGEMHLKKRCSNERMSPRECLNCVVSVLAGFEGSS